MRRLTVSVRSLTEINDLQAVFMKEFKNEFRRGKRTFLSTLRSSAHVDKNAAGLSTCSRTSMEQTISYRFGRDRRVSAGECRYARDPCPDEAVDSEDNFGSAEEWTDAIAMLDSEASMPKVLAPMRAKLLF